MTRITSADFQKNFGHYKRDALAEPLIVTIHGKDTLAVISHDLFTKLEPHIKALKSGKKQPVTSKKAS